MEVTQFASKNVHYQAVKQGIFFFQPSVSTHGSCKVCSSSSNTSNSYEVLKCFKELPSLHPGLAVSAVRTATPTQLSIQLKSLFTEYRQNKNFKSDFQPQGALWIISTGSPRAITARVAYLRQHCYQKTQQKANCFHLPFPL